MLAALLPDFTVTLSWSNRNPPRTWCYIGDLTWPDAEWATNRSRQYTVTLPIVLNAVRARATVEDAEDWLADRATTVFNAFGPDSDIRSIGAITWNVAPRQFGSQPHPDGLEVQAVLELSVTYRP